MYIQNIIINIKLINFCYTWIACLDAILDWASSEHYEKRLFDSYGKIENIKNAKNVSYFLKTEVFQTISRLKAMQEVNK